MKDYKDWELIQSGESYFYGDESELTCVETRIVKTRKIHKCVSCQQDIPSGERVFYQKALVDYSFFGRYYIGMCCLSQWVEELEGD